MEMSKQEPEDRDKLGLEIANSIVKIFNDHKITYREANFILARLQCSIRRSHYNIPIPEFTMESPLLTWDTFSRLPEDCF
jgi:hypothetical protein